MTAPLPTLRERGRKGARVLQNRAELKRRLSCGELHLADLLSDVPEWAGSMRLETVLVALPGIRRRKCERAMVVSQANYWATLGGISERQREVLLEHFREKEHSVWALWDVMAHGPHEETG